MLYTTGTAYTYSYIRTRMIPGTNRVRVTSTYHTYYQGTWYMIRTTLGGTIFSPYVYVGVFLLSSIGHTRRATRGCWASLVYRGGFITFITYLVQNCCTGITGPYPSNQNPRWTQNNIYIPASTHHFRSWVLRTTVIVVVYNLTLAVRARAGGWNISLAFNSR